MFNKKEAEVLINYIDFMAEFDDDPTFRDDALTARVKLETFVQQSLSGSETKGSTPKSCGTCLHKNSDNEIKQCRFCKRNCAENNDDMYEPA